MAAGVLGPIVDLRQVSPGYFATMGIDLLEGRDLTWEDAGDRTRSVVVSETLAGPSGRKPPRFSGGGSGIRGSGPPPGNRGRGPGRPVPDPHRGPGPPAVPPMDAGTPEEADPARSVAVALHVGGDPLGFVGAARKALREVDPRLPLVNPDPCSRWSATPWPPPPSPPSSWASPRIALVLGTVGIYGVIAYVVGRRTQEIGVRMALGAPAVKVLREVMGQGLILAGIGVALGLVGAWGVSRVLVSLLYGVSATDPLTYLGTAAVLVAVALLASWLPARKAARVDPVEALRTE